MKIIVLGKNGMLGRYVYTYLKKNFNTIGTTRQTLRADDNSLYELDVKSGDVVINCIGRIPQRGNTSQQQFSIINTAFPLKVQEFCYNREAKLIHPTSDCVFDGSEGSYTEVSDHTSLDDYGKSKSLGEPLNSTVIRTSILGEEINNKLSLLEWVKSNKNKKVNGFTNHYWNGITCLQFAKICEKIIKHDLFWCGVRHIYSPSSVSKYELVKMISKVYDLNIKVIPIETSSLCDRTLATIIPDIDFKISELMTQLKEQKEFLKMNQLVYENLEVNYVCSSCGKEVIDGFQKRVNCNKCGRRLKEVSPTGIKKR